jgi:hypothetical protein
MSGPDPIEIQPSGKRKPPAGGPRTSKGKAASSKNALKHGLSSQEILLPDEDADEFNTRREHLIQSLEPVGPLECRLVDRIVGLLWRLERAGRIEAGILAWRYHGILRERARNRAAKLVQTEAEQALAMYRREVILDERQHQRALSDETVHAEHQETDLATLGEAVVLDSEGSDSLSKLSRYETTLERSLHRTLHELQRLQSRRQGKEIPAPLALDVDVIGLEKA